MSFNPGGANASSGAQPAATEPWAIISAEQPGDPAAQPVHYPDMQYRLDVRWQVEQAWGQWWDLPQSAAIDMCYRESRAAVTYTYDWGNGWISHYELHFARREQYTLETRRIRRVRRAFVEPIVQALS